MEAKSRVPSIMVSISATAVVAIIIAFVAMMVLAWSLIHSVAILLRENLRFYNSDKRE